jgi:hypothetical protein
MVERTICSCTEVLNKLSNQKAEQIQVEMQQPRPSAYQQLVKKNICGLSTCNPLFDPN